ncbi:hypothetical protein QEW_0447 [Clostridioides difficile CD160]|nr:hypothetical protein QEW_0447 [Clostridioides difficile CD160]
MNNQKIKRFLKIIDKNIDKIKEEAIKTYKESFLEENNNIRIHINLAGKVEALAVPHFCKYTEDIYEREIFVCEFNKEKISIDELLGELYYLKDYEEFKKWCNDEEENLSWYNYKKFNEDNFDELVERHIEDSLSDFLEELNESIENRKKELQEIVAN